MSTETARNEREELCEDLRNIETDMIRELIRLYEQGTNYEVFWERVERVEQFARLRRNFCQD